MNRLKCFTLLLALTTACHVSAKQYKASYFGIKSNGTTLNTTSIQKAIDYIHEAGGDTLVFYVGRYLTGTIELKSNVHIVLREGAILVGSTNIYDYNIDNPFPALVYAKGASNISISGKGVIDGQGFEVAYNLTDQIHKGILDDPMQLDRPANRRPHGIYFRECNNVSISGITLKNTAFWVQTYDQCENLKIDGITVDSKAFWNNDGLDIVDCKEVVVSNSFFDAADDAICFKSHDATKRCENIEVRNCVLGLQRQRHQVRNGYPGWLQEYPHHQQQSVRHVPLRDYHRHPRWGQGGGYPRGQPLRITPGTPSSCASVPAGTRRGREPSIT